MFGHMWYIELTTKKKCMYVSQGFHQVLYQGIVKATGSGVLEDRGGELYKN